MSWQPDYLMEINARLNRLERQNRFLKCGAVAAVVVVAGIALIAAKEPASKVVETQSLVIREPGGKVRGKIEATRADGIVQTLLDDAGIVRVRLSVDNQGTARIWVLDEEGEPRVAAFSRPKTDKENPQQAGLSIAGLGKNRDVQKKEGITLYTDAEKRAVQSLFDSEGNQRVFLATHPDRMAAIALLNKDGNDERSIKLATLANGNATQLFSGNDGKSAYVISADKSGDVGHYVMDQKEHVRLASQLKANGVARTVLQDARGKARVTSYTADDGETGQSHYDTDGKERLFQGTMPDGMATNNLLDRNGKIRASSVVFKDGESSFLLYDARGKLRFNTTTFPNGRIAQSFSSPGGATKASTVVTGDGSVSHYVEKSAADEAWKVTGDVLQFLDLMERLSRDKKK